MVTRLRRLESLLGRRLDDVDYNGIAGLVGNTEAAESEDLDYKQAHYSADDKGREELAKDVASFATTRAVFCSSAWQRARASPAKCSTSTWMTVTCGTSGKS
jgi:hypothetical protein